MEEDATTRSAALARPDAARTAGRPRRGRPDRRGPSTQPLVALGGAPADDVGERLDRWSARALATFFAAGCGLVLVSEPLEQRERLVLSLAVAAAAAVVAGLLASRRSQVASAPRHAALATGSALIAVLVLASGRASTPDGVLLVWVGLYGGFFVGRRALVAHLLVALGLYVAALLLVRGGTPPRMVLTSGLLVGGAMVAAGAWSAGLRALVDGLIAGQADLARTDQLTGLANRHGFQRRVRQLARRSSGHAMLAIDLDDFKPINDAHGHGVGDAVLQAVAGRLRNAVPAEDLVGRMGGDEFVVCVGDLSHDEVVRLAQRLHARLAAPYEIDGLTLELTASIGIAQAADDSPWRTLAAADEAMYDAKRSREGWALPAARPPSDGAAPGGDPEAHA